MGAIIGLIFGFVLATIGCGIFWRVSNKQKKRDFQELFESISAKALRQNNEEFLKIAEDKLKSQTKFNAKELEGKKELIDQKLEQMTDELKKVENLMNSLEKDRENKFGALATQLKTSTIQTEQLRLTADQLRNALTNTQVRGQWGQRMAVDVLRLSGLIEGINFVQQKQLITNANKPDFTFLLPQGLKVNMDAKFAFNNYLKYTEAKTDVEREKYKAEFLKDVKKRIKEVQSKEYINPEENTVDYMIIFIPNEQIFCFIHENDPTIIDEAMKQKVIITSPFTLYAVLAVMRQSIENFNLEKTAGQIYSYLQKFKDQWINFKEEMDKLGTQIGTVQKTFAGLVTTRSNQLEKPLEKIDMLKSENTMASIETKPSPPQAIPKAVDIEM